VYELIEDCRTYDDVKAVLGQTFNKKPNAIFARYQLTTRKQKMGETLEDFLLCLHSLTKNCQLRAITKEEYRQELVRDAFLIPLGSTAIRMWILERGEMSLE